MDAVVARLRPVELKRLLLTTLDAHGVYAQFGFVRVPDPEMFMVLGG